MDLQYLWITSAERSSLESSIQVLGMQKSQVTGYSWFQDGILLPILLYFSPACVLVSSCSYPPSSQPATLLPQQR